MSDYKTSFPHATDLVRQAFAAMNEHEGDLGELIPCALKDIDASTPLPAVMAQLLMEYLPMPGTNPPSDVKDYWIAMGHYMGPDWIGALQSMAALMAKVDGWTA